MHIQNQSGSNNIQVGQNLNIYQKFIEININFKNDESLYSQEQCEPFDFYIENDTDILHKPLRLINGTLLKKTDTSFDSIGKKEWDLLNCLILLLEHSDSGSSLRKRYIKKLAVIKNRSKTRFSNLILSLEEIYFFDSSRSMPVKIIEKYSETDESIDLVFTEDFSSMMNDLSDAIPISYSVVMGFGNKKAKALYERLVALEKLGKNEVIFFEQDFMDIFNKQPHFAHYVRQLKKTILELKEYFNIQIIKTGYSRDFKKFVKLGFYSLGASEIKLAPASPSE